VILVGSLIDQTEREAVVLDLLSTRTFTGSDCDGPPAAAERAADSTYQVTGSLFVAALSVLRKRVGRCSAKAVVVLIGLMSRYIKGPC
jgi:hypothetical protein